MKKKIKLLISKAKKGNVEAQHELGLCYVLGKGVEQNYNKAMKWWKSASLKGFGKAHYNMGCLYRNGHGTPMNLEKAFYYFNLSIKKEHAYQVHSYLILGKLFFIDGNFVKKNINKGIKYMQIAAEKNFVNAQYLLATIYDGSIDEGIEIKINKVKAFKYYLMAAKNKFIPALIRVSDMYGNGIGTKKDPKKSYEYLKLVSKSNNDNLIDSFKLLPAATISLKKLAKQQKLRVKKILEKK